MASLLYEELASAGQLALVSLSEDRVEWLAEDLFVEEPGEVGTHHVLHALHGVIRHGCLCHVDWPGHRKI